MKKINKLSVGVIGLGYVGLPLAIEFGKKYRTLGYDINNARIGELQKGIDVTNETTNEELKSLNRLKLSCNEVDLNEVNFFIVTVPTPIDKYKNPDLQILRKATKLIAKYLKKGDIVVYESTVYPGVTEEYCAPILQEYSGLVFNKDFYCGYSPERINPGDKVHSLTKIIKITSGSTISVADKIDKIYNSIISAGTHRAPSIKVAEAAKVIENAQRDINIAFVNELAKIFNLMGIDTGAVLEAAGTKWNFLPFKPGLVGGHCIGVDPFYLAQKAKELGYDSEIILSGRKMNDSMAKYVSDRFIKLLILNNIKIKSCRVLILGATFKENCPDIRNSKVFDIVEELKSYCVDVVLHDPWANSTEVKNQYGIDIENEIDANYDGILLCVGHEKFINYPFEDWKKGGSIIYDLKGIIPSGITDLRL